MNAREYIDGVADKIQDEELRERLREELNDHWTDYCDQHSMKDDPKNVLGDATLTIKQANASQSPREFEKDMVRSGLCAVGMFFLFNLFSSFFDFDLNTISESILQLLSQLVGLSIWGFATWCLFLSLHRRILVQYGSSSLKRSILLTIAVPVPCVLAWMESSTVPFMLIPLDLTRLITPAIVLILFLKGFANAGKMVQNRFSDVEQFLHKLRHNGPVVISLFVALGTALLVVNEDLAIMAAPLTLPLLILYVAWALASTGAGWLFNLAGLPAMMGFYLVILLALFIGIVLPVVYLLKNRRIPSTLHFVAAGIIPLAIILPGIPQDVPKIEWGVPVVWSWDQLEKKQLNIAYPWAASLMRSNDGTNLGYGAVVENGIIQVTQQGGRTYQIRKGGNVLPISKQAPTKKMDFEQFLSPLPQGFSCDGQALESLVPEGQSTEQKPLGIFGVDCPILSYQGKEIARLDRWLMDLDLSEDGLLAVSITMGSYDPTYVYVVDISSIQ